MLNTCFRTGTVVALALLTSACGTVPSLYGPEPLVEENPALLAGYAQYGPTLKDYSAADAESDRRRIRDKFIGARLAVLDTRFITYARTVSTDKKALDAVTEATQLTLSVAATLVGGVQAKENLAATMALVTGGKATVDKHYFNNQAVSAILSTMVALRKEHFARILAGTQQPTDQYSLLQASRDLNDYEIAGTMDGAVLAIQGEANRRENNATQKIERLTVVRNVLQNLGTTAAADKGSLTRALDPKTLTIAKATAALQELGVPQASIPATLEEQAELLQDFVRSADTDTKVAKVKAAFVKAGIVKP